MVVVVKLCAADPGRLSSYAGGDRTLVAWSWWWEWEWEWEWEWSGAVSRLAPPVAALEPGLGMELPPKIFRPAESSRGPDLALDLASLRSRAVLVRFRGRLVECLNCRPEGLLRSGCVRNSFGTYPEG